MIITADKRWEGGAQRWVKPPVLFNPAGYTVDVVRQGEARAFVQENHYSRSCCSCRLAVGIRNAAQQLVGVAVFSEPYKHALRYWTGLDDTSQGAEPGALRV